MTLTGSILVTGGAGSFGQAVCRHLLDQHDPRRVIVYSRDEWKHSQMAQTFTDSRMRWFLGDVRDQERLTTAFQGVDIVVHAAALKRVDSIAYNPDEAMKTNVWGTHNVLNAARDAGVEKVLLISSDKAVHPTNHYGMTKGMAEHLTTGANIYGVPQGVRSASVRYGNVLGSRGSVIHLWREQAKTGTLQLTDPRMTRFFITLAEACALVTTALDRMEGGEIFLPKIRAGRMVDLAKAIAPSAMLETVGLRAGGEKLHERLLSDEEVSRTLDLGPCYVVLPNPHPWAREGFAHDGALVHPDWQYASNEGYRLSVDEIRTLLDSVP